MVSDPVKRSRFDAQYEAAKARGDVVVALSNASNAAAKPWLLAVDVNTHLDAEIACFLTSMKPVVRRSLMAKTLATTTNPKNKRTLFDMATRSESQSALDSELYADLAMRIAANGEDQAFKDLDAEEMEALIEGHDEHLRRQIAYLLMNA
jgi:nitrogenase subunit NifH